MSREALNSFHIHQKYWGVRGIALLWDHATVTKDGRKIYDAIFKKLSHQTNNCRFLVSINAKTICSYFLFLQGWPTVGWLSGMIWVVVEFDNEFIWLGPIATGASSVKKLAGPHRCLQVGTGGYPSNHHTSPDRLLLCSGEAHKLIPVKK